MADQGGDQAGRRAADQGGSWTEIGVTTQPSRVRSAAWRRPGLLLLLRTSDDG